MILNILRVKNLTKKMMIFGNKKKPKDRECHQTKDFGGERWIRTTEVDGRQIYSLFPLATRESPQIKKMELVNGIEPSTY